MANKSDIAATLAPEVPLEPDFNPTEDLQRAIEVLQKAREEVLELLGDNFGVVQITLSTTFDRLINNLAFLSNGQPTGSPVRVVYEPVTSFFGEPIDIPQRVTPEQLLPKEEEKSRFLSKVNDLQDNLQYLSNARIIEDYVTKEDQNAIRGVAKRAGLPDFKTAEINEDFMNRIRAGLKAKADKEAKVKKTNENIDEGKAE